MQRSGHYDEDGDWVVDAARWDTYSPVIAFAGKVPDVVIRDQKVSNNRVTFRFGVSYEKSEDEYGTDTIYSIQDKVEPSNSREIGWADNYYPMGDDTGITGFEIYRANKTRKYKKIATVTDTYYKDIGLKSDTVYCYRIRAYVLDETTGRKVYGDWIYRKVTTWRKELDLQATASNTKAVKR